jgi:SAM-dependent methyltransferase
MTGKYLWPMRRKTLPNKAELKLLVTTTLRKDQIADGYLEKRDANASFWTNQAIQHGVSIAATATTHFIRDATLKRLKRLIPPDSSILEVGCGNGSSFLGPLSRDCRAYGIDLSMEMLLAAKSHKEIKGIIRSEACCLPFGDASFDVVYTSRCLINVLDGDMQRLAIREAFRVAKPDGIVVFVENFQQPVRSLNQVTTRLHAGTPDIDDHNLLLNLPMTLECSEQLGWHPAWIRGNTLGSFVAHVLVRGITRQRGTRIVGHLLHPLYVALTWIEDNFGSRLPLYGKDTMIVLKKTVLKRTVPKKIA